MTEEKKLTGYPSIDKPWLKYYIEDADTFIVPEISFYNNMKERAGAFLDMPALEYFGFKTSYRKMLIRIEQAAKALRAIGVNEGQIVSASLPNMPEAVYLFYAINRIGAVANMLDLRCSEKWLKKAIIEADSEVLICLDSVATKFGRFLSETKVKTAIAVSPITSIPFLPQKVMRLIRAELRTETPDGFMLWNDFIKKSSLCPGIIDAPYVPNADAVIAYTGGTTGDPKGVIGTNETINAQFLAQLQFGHNCNCRDRILCVAPPWTYYGLCNSLNNYLCIGACIVLVPKFDGAELGMLIRKNKPNFIVMVPSNLTSLLDDQRMKGFDLSFIKTFVVGADKLEESLELQVNDFLSNHGCKTVITKGYGMTEVMAAAACSKPDGFIGSVGIPIPGTIISAFHENDGRITECRTGEIGELAISGPCVMKSYFGDAFIENKNILKQHTDGKTWAHTGDMGYIDENGRVNIVGRIKRMFVRNGYKVFPASIEKSIVQHPAVLEAAVVSVSDHILGHRIHAVIVLRQGNHDKEKIKNELQRMLSAGLYDYELPDYYSFCDGLPLTPLGKVDYQTIEKMVEGNA